MIPALILRLPVVPIKTKMIDTCNTLDKACTLYLLALFKTALLTSLNSVAVAMVFAAWIKSYVRSVELCRGSVNSRKPQCRINTQTVSYK